MSSFPSASRGTGQVRRLVPLREQPDERLVALARGGSDEAVAEIVRRYEGPLRAHCSRIVDPGRAEDAVQQAFLHALRALRGPDRRELALKAWLHTIARNCAIDLHTRRRVDAFEEFDGAPDGAHSPPRVLEQREELSQLVAGLRRLPDGQRRALLLRELEGRSYEEIGIAIGRTPSGVRQTIFRARTALREAVAVFAAPMWLRALWPFGGASPGRSLEAVAAVGAAIVAVAGTAGPASPRAVPDGVPHASRVAIIAPAGPGEESLPATPPAAGSWSGGTAPVRPRRPDTPESRSPLREVEAPLPTSPSPPPRPSPVPGDDPDGGKTPSAPAQREPGEGQTPPSPAAPVEPGEAQAAPPNPPPDEGQSPPSGDGQTPLLPGESPAPGSRDSGSGHAYGHRQADARGRGRGRGRGVDSGHRDDHEEPTR